MRFGFGSWRAWGLAAVALGVGLGTAAVAQTAWPTLPANTVVGRLNIGTGPAEAIPFTTLATNIATSGGLLLSANNLSDVASVSTARTNLGLASLYGVSAVAHEWIASVTAGVPSLTQPAFTDISGTAGVNQGGTGVADPTAHSIQIGEGASAFNSVGPCNSNVPVTGLGSSSDPQCGGTIQPANGGSGDSSPTAHSLLQAEGSSVYGLLTASTAGNIPIDQGSGSDWLSKTVGGDCTLAASGSLTCVKTNGTAFGPWATLASETANVLYKGNGSSAPVASALLDNGTIVASSESVDVQGNAYVVEVPNNSSTATVLNKLAILTGTGTATVATTGTTDGILGIVVGGAGTSGNAQIATRGLANCVFDGATTANDWVQISGSSGGECHDSGSATRASAEYQVGFVLSTNSGAGTYAVELNQQYTPSGGGGSGTVNSGTTGQVAYYSSSGTAVGGENVASIATTGVTAGFGLTGGGTTGVLSLAASPCPPSPCTIISTTATTCNNGGSAADDGVYTTPTCQGQGPLYIEAKLVGGGGGGGGGNNATGGTSGNPTCLSTSSSPCTSPVYEAGGGGASGDGGGGSGGTTSGSGTFTESIPGAPGGYGSPGGSAYGTGGNGGNSCIGGGAGTGPGANNSGITGATNTGGGGSGGGTNTSESGWAGGGGGGGACGMVIITSPASTYYYSIAGTAAGGSGGTGGGAGGAGAAGRLRLIARWQ